MVAEKRTNEVKSLLATLRRQAQGKPEIVAVGLVGSWVRDARMDSDADVVLLTEERAPYPEDDAWVREVGGVEFVWTRQWGTVTERRFALPSGLEVELSVAPLPGRSPTRWTRARAGSSPTVCRFSMPRRGSSPACWTPAADHRRRRTPSD